MPLGTEIGLGPGHIVLDGDPALPTEMDTLFSHGRPSQQLLSACYKGLIAECLDESILKITLHRVK